MNKFAIKIKLHEISYPVYVMDEGYKHSFLFADGKTWLGNSLEHTKLFSEFNEALFVAEELYSYCTDFKSNETKFEIVSVEIRLQPETAVTVLHRYSQYGPNGIVSQKRKAQKSDSK